MVGKEKTMRISITGATLLILTIAAMWFIGHLYRTGPQAAELTWSDKPTRQPVVPLAVDAVDFPEAAYYSTIFWNRVMPVDDDGFHKDLFYANDEGPRVRVLSANGEPCGSSLLTRPPEEDGHSAVTYECADGTWEIHVYYPGDRHTIYCILAHEFGHVLGLADDKSGSMVMNQKVCPEAVRVSDKDAAAVIERYQ
jgi:hypothetical protein